MIDLKQFFKNIAIKLSRGAHSSPEGGLCVMECVAYMEGEQHSDKPSCACSFVTEFAIRTNDLAERDHERQELLPFIHRIAGSNKNVVRQRAHMAVRFMQDRGRYIQFAYDPYSSINDVAPSMCDGIPRRTDKHMMELLHSCLHHGDFRYIAVRVAHELTHKERLQLLDDMLKMTDPVDITPEREAKLKEAQQLQPVTA